MQHISLPWGGTCVHDEYWISQGTPMCFGGAGSGRFFLNLTAHLAATGCRAVVVTREKARRPRP